MSEGVSTRSTPRAALALLLLLPAPTLGVLAAMFLWPDTTLGKALHLSAKLWILVVPVAWILFIERGRLTLPRWSARGMPAGVITGLLTVAVILGAWHLFARQWVDVQFFRGKMNDIGLDTPAKFLLFATLITLVNALLEEYVWRWFVYAKFVEVLRGPVRAIAVPGAIVLAGLFFTLHHTVAMSFYFDWPTTLLASLGVFLGGVTWSILYLRYKNIYAGYVSHMFADIGLFIVGYGIAFG